MNPKQCRHLFTPEKRYLIAVSGGIDSTVCAHFLHSQKKAFQIELGLAYIHHGLRKEADLETEFVRQFADDLGLPFITSSLELQKGADLQQRARKARYAALWKIAKDHEYDFIVTAHNLDDQAETVLFRMLRGAGASGLAGILPQSGNLVRPFLEFSRLQIEQYAKANSIDFMEDASNAKDDYTRNRLRHKALPLLNDLMCNDVRPVLARFAQISRWEREVLEERAEQDAKCVDFKGVSEAAIDFNQLDLLSKGRRLGLFRHAIKFISGDLSKISFAHLVAVDDLCKSANPSAKLTLPNELTVRRKYDRVVILKEPKEPLEIDPLVLEMPGSFEFGDTIVEMEIQSKEEIDKKYSHILDTEKVNFPLIARSRQPGDHIRFYGRKGTRTLSDLFINAKIPRDERKKIPVICDSEGIVCVVGMGIGEHVCVDDLTKTCLCLSFRRVKDRE